MNHKKPDENSTVDETGTSDATQNQVDENAKKTKTNKNNANEPNPQTMDNLSFYAILLGLGAIFSTGSYFILRKNEN